MSCCVKSSFLRSLAEQKGQKSMLIKGCGQILACGFALIKTKCSCSRKTLQIYSSKSAHWLWGEPVGFGPFRALTKKSQHFPPEVWGVCVLHMFVRSLWVRCACGHSAPWAFLFFHILSGTPASHSVSPLLTWGWSTGHPSMLNISLKIHPPDGPCPCSSLSGIACIFCLAQKHRSFYGNKQTNKHLVCFWGQRSVPCRKSSSIMMRDGPRISKLLMSLFFQHVKQTTGASPVVCFTCRTDRKCRAVFPVHSCTASCPAL